MTAVGETIAKQAAQLLPRISRSYHVVWNGRAACRRWQFQTCEFWRFACSQYLLMYSPDGTNVCGTRGREFEWRGRCRGLKVVKSCFYGALRSY